MAYRILWQIYTISSCLAILVRQAITVTYCKREIKRPSQLQKGYSVGIIFLYKETNFSQAQLLNRTKSCNEVCESQAE